ncbi:hypothetical protein WJX73_003226 [Symbiochloris irregularis]|uniref:Uncharacterized protein n=1 Tax=Symbiochloris irregularis TaxID=706552 RepID=A0AAW1NSX8_9CHLO
MTATEAEQHVQLGLGDYGSDSEGNSDGSPANTRAEQQKARGAAPDSEDDSYFDGSGSESEDSATKRRKAAEARLVDMAESAPGPAQPLPLPSPLDAMQKTAARPDFLNPEATRQLANPIHGNRPSLANAPASTAQQSTRGDDSGAKQGPGFDIARMAPPLKGQARPGANAVSARAVLSAAPTRNVPKDDSEDGGNAHGLSTAAQIAMLGGQWKPSAAEPLAGANGDSGVKRKATAAMGVSEFMEKGVGGAALPRNRQDRKDKEKLKRGKGQSSVGSWKTEAEMVLRQQYDS